MDGYADAGPTHYATEDMACLRAIINAHVLTASDGEVARYLAIDAIARPRLSFVRLDRHAGDDLSPRAQLADVRRGFRVMRNGCRLAVVSHGFMLGRALDVVVQEADFADVAVIDLIQVKPMPAELIEYLSNCEAVLTIEEQTPSGGLAAAVLEAMADRGLTRPFYRLALPERYFFENGGRNRLLEIAKLSPHDIAGKIRSILIPPEIVSRIVLTSAARLSLV